MIEAGGRRPAMVGRRPTFKERSAPSGTRKPVYTVTQNLLTGGSGLEHVASTYLFGYLVARVIPPKLVGLFISSRRSL
jgi:hypothetical protein